MRKIITLVMGALMVIGLATPAFADEGRSTDRDRHHSHESWRGHDRDDWRRHDRDDRRRFDRDDCWRFNRDGWGWSSCRWPDRDRDDD
ncbi:MAG TPA: hypothetical protein VGL92_01105 [Acidimicrobiia bacterium]|jgi:hypothetical protein